MTDILAVGGFWLCMIALILKRPLTTVIMRNQAQESKDVKALKARLSEIESVMATMNKDVFEMKESSDFANKLLITSAHQIAEAHKMLIESANRADNRIAMSVQPAPTPTPQNLLTYTPVPLSELGKIVNDTTVCFERTIAAPIEKVWEYLTTPQGLSRWLASGTMEARVGGRVELNFDTEEMPQRKQKGAHVFGVVNRYEPLKAIAFSWMDASNNLDSAVTFEVTARGEQTELTVTHTRLPKNGMQDFLSGWHTHLDVLKARLTNLVPPNFAHRFQEVSKTYAAVVAATIVVSGAAMPAAEAANQPEIYQTIKTEKAQLESKYDLLARDAENLKRQIDMLKRDSSDEAAHAADKLQQGLDNDYRELHRIELDIKDLNRAAL